jgi:hypothetical protein
MDGKARSVDNILTERLYRSIKFKRRYYASILLNFGSKNFDPLGVLVMGDSGLQALSAKAVQDPNEIITERYE